LQSNTAQLIKKMSVKSEQAWAISEEEWEQKEKRETKSGA